MASIEFSSNFVLVLDLDLGSGDDVDLVSFVREKEPSTRLILLFDMTMLERAIEGIRHGAFFYLPKTCPPWMPPPASIPEKARG